MKKRQDQEASRVSNFRGLKEAKIWQEAWDKTVPIKDTEPVLPVSAPYEWDYETDVLVVGAGGTGLSAAVTAVEKGAKVMAIEKNAFCLGNSGTCARYSPIFEYRGHSKWEKSLGVEGVPLNVALWRANNLLFAGRADLRVLRKIMESEARTMDWLIDEVGVKLYDLSEYPGAMRSQMAKDPDNPEMSSDELDLFGCLGFAKMLEKRVRDLGVEILLQTPAVSLVKEATKMVGVRAKTKEGKILHIKSKATILSDGGFCSNEAMLKKYARPEDFESIVCYLGLPSNTGDGIRMAQGAGASVTNMDQYCLWIGGVPGMGHGPMAYRSALAPAVRAKSLWINKLGERFTDESLRSESRSLYGLGWRYDAQNRQIALQPDHTAFAIHDSVTRLRKTILERTDPLSCEIPAIDHDEDFDRWVEKGVIIKTDTIEELIEELTEKMGVNPKALKATIDRYNENCDKGEDPDFFKPDRYMIPIKKPPFYAIKVTGGFIFDTVGGVITNDRFQVLDKEGRIIGGLYASGSTTAHVLFMMGALVTGHVAGEKAAEEAIGE